MNPKTDTQNKMKSFVLKNSIHGITETFTVVGGQVEVRCNAGFQQIPSVGWLSIEQARNLWKEMTQNGWVRI